MDQSRPSSIAVHLARAAIRGYQLIMSGQPPRCRFAPSCSVYAREALADYGFFKGFTLSVRRLLKCHPWNAGGYDPIPLRRL